ncbi:Arm DNA-binding domain-containing protein, partial [Phocaeicola vulgatus]|uniref:Arm DNA-binding domain-containing protein n=1 Tax=Phocaeicola vulgatus TaxID=821 RepID=UPI000ECD4FA8
MATTVNVLCYKSKTLSNGEHPLMIRICKDGKKKYVSLGVSVRAEHWNFEKNGLSRFLAGIIFYTREVLL